MPPGPSPSTASRRGARALVQLALPLAVGFATGAWLALPADDEAMRARSADGVVLEEPSAPDDEAHRAARARRRARERSHRDALTNSQATPEATPEAAPEATADAAAAPTRRSVQEAIDAIDPRDWLASYGNVVEMPVATD